MSDLFVYRIPLPEGIDETIIPNTEDDGYTVYIDQDLDDACAYKAYQHAVGHVLNNDFEKDDVQSIELNAH